MKSFIIKVVLIVATLLLFCFGVYLIDRSTIKETRYEDLEIIDAVPSVSGQYHNEYTLFVVKTEQGHYTLPKVPTSIVRAYYVGDLLPVRIDIRVDGTKELSVNKEALVKYGE